MTADDMTLRVLNDIQSKLADQSRRFDSLDERLGRIDRRLDGVRATLCVEARLDRIERRLDLVGSPH